MNPLVSSHSGLDQLQWLLLTPIPTGELGPLNRMSRSNLQFFFFDPIVRIETTQGITAFAEFLPNIPVLAGFIMYSGTHDPRETVLSERLSLVLDFQHQVPWGCPSWDLRNVAKVHLLIQELEHLDISYKVRELRAFF